MREEQLKLDLKSIEGKVSISDGYHTFDELYEHRITLYIALCKAKQRRLYDGGIKNHLPVKIWADQLVWRSKLQSDGSNYKGWFILGIERAKGKQITFHIPLKRWKETNFAQTLIKAPKFDGQTSQVVLERIKSL